MLQDNPHITPRLRRALIAGTIGLFALLVPLTALYFKPALNWLVSSDYSLDKVHVVDGEITRFAPFFYGSRNFASYRRWKHRPSQGVEVSIRYTDSKNVVRQFHEHWPLTTFQEYEVGDVVPVVILAYNGLPGSIYEQESRIRYIVSKGKEQLEQLTPSDTEKLSRLTKHLETYRDSLARAWASRRRRASPNEWPTIRAQWEAEHPQLIPTSVLLARGEFAPGGKYAPSSKE